MEEDPLPSGTIEVEFVEGAQFRFVCNGTCDVGWEPDFAWDLPIRIDVLLEFGIRGFAELVFDPKLLEFGEDPRDWRAQVYRPKGYSRNN